MKSIRLLLLPLLLALAACTTPPSTPPPSKPRVHISLGFRPGVVVDLALLQAIERGDLSAQGFDVELKPYGRADLIFAALGSDEIQGSLGVPLEPMLDQATKGNYPYRGYIVWYFDDKTPYDGMVAQAASPIKNVQDLKNKIVGSHPSRQVTYFASQFLKDSQVKPYNPAAPLASLDSGDMAAVYVLEPFLSIARTTSRYRVLETNLISKGVFAGDRVPAALSVLSSSWIEKHPSEAEEFVRLARAAYINDAQHRDKNLIVTILTQPRFGLSSDVASQVAEPASSLPEDMNSAQLDHFVGVLRRGKLLTGDFTFDKLLYVPQKKN